MKQYIDICIVHSGFVVLIKFDQLRAFNFVTVRTILEPNF